MIAVGGCGVDFMGQASGGCAARCEAEFGAQGVAVARIAFEQTQRDQVIHALGEGGAAGACGGEQRGLPPCDARMQAGQDGQGPCAGGDVDKQIYVHKI